MRLTESDLERLADYAAGVATDRAASAEVARLVRTDPTWTAAYRAVVDADHRVRRDLHRHAQTGPESMPADVAARLDEALRRAALSPSQPQIAPRSAPDSRHLGARPSGGSRPTGRPVARATTRRRRRLYAGLAAAAAAVTVLAGVALTGGLASLTTTPNTASDRAADGLGGAPQSAEAWAPETRTPTAFMASGTDYTAQTLASLGRTPMGLGGVPSLYPVPSSKGTSAATAVTAPDAVRDQAPPALAGLTEPVALHACLDAITANHPGVVALVDYARFNGAPALIVLVRRADGGTVVAVGAACGATGADEKASAPA